MITLLSSFSCKRDTFVEGLGGKSISKAISVKVDNLKNPLGGLQIAGSFNIAHGGYEVDGGQLANDIEKTNIIRQK